MKLILFLSISLIIFFATNDGLRDTFFESSALSYLKELIVFLLFTFLTITCFVKQRVSHKSMVTFNLVVLFLLITSFITTMLSGYENFLRADVLSFGGLSVWVKALVFALLTNSLVLLYETDRKTYDAIPRIYIIGGAFYAILTFFFVASGLNKALPMRDWYGRLSIGYPPMDSFVLVVACAFSAFYVRKISYVVLLHLLFTTALAMQNTASGYLLYFGYLIFMVFALRGKWKLIPLSFIAAIITGAAYTYVYLATEMGAFGAVIIDKINGFIFGDKTSSITIRQEQISYLLGVLKSDILLSFFGIGGVGAFAVENQYYSILGMFGLIGICLYALLLLSMLFAFKRNKDYFCLLLLLLYSIGSTSLAGIYVYPFVFVASYIVSRYYLIRNANSLKISRI